MVECNLFFKIKCRFFTVQIMFPIHYLEAAAIIPLGDFVTQDYAWILAGTFALVGIISSFYNIALHLAHWTRPVYQIWIVRILFIVPLYAIISFISIHEQTVGLYMEIIRDCYEAFVIYCFLVWILNVIGGEQACAVSIAQRMAMKHPFPLCCLPPLRLNAAFLRTCKQMTLQFVILKPITATISFLLLVIGGETLYYNSIWQLIMLTAYNVSYTLALYGLFLFYVATKDEMNSFSPVRKFLAVKSIVFMTYWQALFIPIIFGSKYSDKTNDFVLCLEMVVFAFMHYRAFPWWEFKYRQLSIDKVGYGFTGFSGMDEDHSDPVTPTEDSYGMGTDFEYKKFSSFGDSEEKDLEDVNGIESMQEQRVFEDGNKEIQTVPEEMVSIKSWCCAFWDVINFVDVCNDAKANFVEPSVDLMDNPGMTPQGSYDDDINDKTKDKAKQLLNANLLFDDGNKELRTKKQRTHQYVKEYERTNLNIELK
eukprot:737336_1